MRSPLPLPPLIASGDFSPDGHGVHAFDPVTNRVPTLPGFEGIRLLPEFLTGDEAETLVARLRGAPFVPSQSGREKCHYGPRANFNRRRVNTDRFEGLPGYAFEIEARLRERAAAAFAPADPVHEALATFVATDAFVLRYDPARSSNLDFHLDDEFAYGELILDLSLESDATLTFYRGRPEGEVDDPPGGTPACVRVPIPERSLTLVFGDARHAWEHALLAPDVSGPRTSITLRTISPILAGRPEGREILERAKRRIAPD